MTRRPDPDRSLEHLLRRAWPAAVTDSPDCLDAERLAAWSSGSLPPAERGRVEEHLSNCARCQTMLAVFAAAEPPAPATVPFWRRARARWIVPITVGAAATIIWMARPADVHRTSPEPASTMARVEPPPASPPEREAVGRTMTQTASKPASPPAGDALNDAATPRAELREAPGPPPAPAAPVPAPQATAERVSEPARAAEAGALMRAAAAPPMTADIVSPDPAFRWRIRNGLVEHTTTAGASWQPAVLPAGVDVTDGASPAPLVCWLIGPAGLVLRTTDGSHFEAATRPDAGPLTSVRAVDADRATVTTADGRSFSTTDGGRTWR